MLRGCCKDGDNEGSSANGMPPYGDRVQILENTHAKGVDRAYVEVGGDSTV